MRALPLIRDYAAGAVFARHEGAPVLARDFLQEVEQLARLLPARPHVINLCADRYRFAVAFAAALARGQVNLLPPNQTAAMLRQLSSAYPGAYCLVDDAGPGGHLETMAYPQLGGTHASTPVPAFAPGQTAAIIFTSGSTGAPVPNRKSWGSLVASAAAEADRLGVSAHPRMSVLGTVPPQHMYGLESTVLLVVQAGLVLQAGRPFYPADIRAELAALPRPRGLVTTPVHLRALLAEPEPLPRVDLLLCATAPLAPQLAAAAETAFGTPLLEIYGCTEAGQVATRRTVEGAEWRALSGVTLRQDEKGSWVKGGHVETEVLLSDVIELRGRGKFLLHGRNADLVNIAGKRTSIANLNYHLNSIDGVRDGVFVMPEESGAGVTRLMAFVVAPGLDSEAVMNALRERLDAAFLPRPLCLVEALPRNPTGKLPRQALNDLAAQAQVKTG